MADTLTAWRPRVSYGATPTVWDADFPLVPHAVRAGADAGHATAGSGARESYVRRAIERARLRLRFFEYEWPAVNAWLRWAQANLGTPFDFRFDQAVSGTEYSVYLAAPLPGEDYEPDRSRDYAGLLELDVTLESAAGAAFDVRYVALS